MICETCKLDKDAPREPVITNTDAFTISEYLENQCDGCGHQKDGSTLGRR